MPDASIADQAWQMLVGESRRLALLAVLFSLLALAVKRRRLLADARRALPAVRLNLIYHLIDLAAVLPLMVLLVDLIDRATTAGGLRLLNTADFAVWPLWVAVLACVVVSDFIGYWRHRLLHLSALWPVHAIHHSDPAMTATTLMRFHPLNRLATTAINAMALSLVGFPPAVIAINGVIRTWYGFAVHADLPWTWGPLRRILVSPVMHRWHHVRDMTGHGTNFATVFALWDVLFGTWRMPPTAMPPLGVRDAGFPATWLAQTLWPFFVWRRRLVRKLHQGGRAPV
ncbi:MAG: sterol desaturase family protein [Alphaproteobacteria bacterium]